MSIFARFNSYPFLSLGHKPRSLWTYEELITNIMMDQSERVWNADDTAVLWFPRIFHCIEHMAGPSGTLERFDVFCINQMSSWVEGFCILNLFCLAVLGFIWILDVICTNLYLTCFPLYRQKKHTLHQNCYTFQELSMSKKLFVILLMQNLEPLFWDDVVNNILSTRKKHILGKMVLPRKKIYEYIEEEQMQQSLKERIECKKSQNSLSEMDIELDEIISLKD